MTDLTAAALLAMVLSFVVFTTAAAWYAVPRMRAVALAAAITRCCGFTPSGMPPCS
jgi:hypothetical protein